MKVGYLQGQSLYIQNNEYKKTSQTEVVEVKNPNEAFQQNYINGNITEAKNCIDYIDVNYDDGYFLTLTAKNGDSEMLSALIKKGADVSIADESALRAAARNGHKECVELLINNGANPRKLIGTSSYNNHEHIKQLLKCEITYPDFTRRLDIDIKEQSTKLQLDENLKQKIGELKLEHNCSPSAKIVNLKKVEEQLISIQTDIQKVILEFKQSEELEEKVNVLDIHTQIKEIPMSTKESHYKLMDTLLTRYLKDLNSYVFKGFNQGTSCNLII